ncbi:MAG: hypothetical protein IH598_05020 [Bacteroidales bacterium]|nr:hypothetical protein [Bacteroidales bacterium]
MSNIQFMMHLLNFYTNQKLKRKITMEIIDLKDEQGEAKGTLGCLYSITRNSKGTWSS